MLQNTEYKPFAYLAWYKRVSNFSSVMYRRTLEKTKPARLILLALRMGMITQFIIGVFLIIWGYQYGNILLTLFGTLLIATYPFVWAYLIIVPLIIGRVLIVNPKNKKLIKASEKIFNNHPGIKIAVAGSYGKTSMKELLSTVLSQGKKVAATPANKNVAISHAYFAQSLKGDEDVLIIEYGEGAPGDVEKFAKVTQPKIGIITGLAPAHLDQYPTLEAAGKDIFSIQDYVDHNKLYVNSDSEAALKFIKKSFKTYDHNHALGWNISDISVDITGIRFVMKKGTETLKLQSALLGRHQVGPLALVAALSHELGLSKKQIEAGVGLTKPFEHRMEARPLNGAWILDDTYNGNIDGMKAGLALMTDIKAKRKIYVTPGLVDQGTEHKRVHLELGKAIADANPNLVVLMNNSSTESITQGLNQNNFNGELQIVDKPLEFYNNIEHIIAAGDLIILQNDLPDNYN